MSLKYGTDGSMVAEGSKYCWVLAKLTARYAHRNPTMQFGSWINKFSTQGFLWAK